VKRKRTSIRRVDILHCDSPATFARCVSPPTFARRFVRRLGRSNLGSNTGIDLETGSFRQFGAKTEAEAEIDLAATHRKLEEIEAAIRKATAKHNGFLKELGLSPLPSNDPDPPGM
jgi:type I restriction enzyme M protein